MSLGLFHKNLFSYFFLDELTDPVKKKKKAKKYFSHNYFKCIKMQRVCCDVGLHPSGGTSVPQKQL